MIVQTQKIVFDRPLKLESGATLEPPIQVAYETYGRLNAERTNAILICHALSGDAHAAGRHKPDEEKVGWWDNAIGPGKAFDTDRYFVVCSNVIGGCSGSTGPSSINPKTGKPYALTFPVVTIRDMIEVQAWLLDHLQVDTLLSVAGGSMGGMQALQWSISFPDRVRSAVVLASTASVSPQAIAFDEVGRQAIYADPNWKRGDYYGGEPPNRGLAVARMVGHITYLSDKSMRNKFGRHLQGRERYGYDFATDFQVESYLRYKGDHFTKRFDANSYLYITKAIDYFDLTRGTDHLAPAFEKARARFLVVSYSSDWLYPPEESERIVRALLQNGLDATYVETQSDYGHDAFLLEAEKLAGLTRDFLQRVEREWEKERHHSKNRRAASDRGESH